MGIPKAVIEVPRAKVPQTVRAMLTNPEVGDVRCERQPDGTYRVVPSPIGK